MAVVIQVTSGVVQAVYRDPTIKAAYVIIDEDEPEENDDHLIEYEWQGRKEQVMAWKIPEFDQLNPEIEEILRKLKEKKT
jgi:hypothetical protein